MLIIRHEAELLPKSAHVIKILYDCDLVLEDSILAWGEKPSSKYVKKAKAKEILDKVAPVLKWLKEAEEEDSDEEEDDDEIAVSLDVFLSKWLFQFDTNRPLQARPETVAPKENVTVKNEVGDDIEIDDI